MGIKSIDNGSKSRVLRLPVIMPRKGKIVIQDALTLRQKNWTEQDKFIKTFLSELDSIGEEQTGEFCEKIIDGLKQIKEFCRSPDVKNMYCGFPDLVDDEIFYILEFLLKKLQRLQRQDPSYWWLTFFYSLEHLPSGFFNRHLDITAKILLKCYEFLSLKYRGQQGNTQLFNIQDSLEIITRDLTSKIENKNKQELAKEILSGELTFSSHHQYDSSSLHHYLF